MSNGGEHMRSPDARPDFRAQKPQPKTEEAAVVIREIANADAAIDKAIDTLLEKNKKCTNDEIMTKARINNIVAHLNEAKEKLKDASISTNKL